MQTTFQEPVFVKNNQKPKTESQNKFAEEIEDDNQPQIEFGLEDEILGD